MHDNYYETAASNFSKAVTELAASNQSNPTMLCLMTGLRQLAQGLLQESQEQGRRLTAIEAALQIQR
jgi:hypothetical protein